jgi:hypothetical protein
MAFIILVRIWVARKVVYPGERESWVEYAIAGRQEECREVRIGVIAEGVNGLLRASKESFVSCAERTEMEVLAERIALSFGVSVEEDGCAGSVEGEEREVERRERRARVVESAEV